MSSNSPNPPLIEPTLPSGFQDFSPSRSITRNRMLGIIGRVYERFGFVPLQTSEVEFLDTLTGGDPNFAKEIYCVARRDRKGNVNLDDDRVMALRFDLTVSLARFVAANPDLPMPFKRWQVGNVWRGEKAQQGRYRQFAQCDADIVGASSVLADAEIIMVMYAVMQELDVERFVIRFNNRKILNGLLELCGLTDKRATIALRIMDKLEKTGIEKVRADLQREPADDFDDDALALPDDVAERIASFLQLSNVQDSTAALTAVRNLLSQSDLAMEGVAELEEICEYLDTAGIPRTHWHIDLSIARGLGYYTGPVFETTLLDAPTFGSVYSGGRFDGLVERFSNRSVPATGASIGVDRLLAALEHLGKIPETPNWIDVFILRLDASLTPQYLNMAQELRAAGLRVEIYMGKEKGLRNQLGLAQSRGLPIVIIYGSQEHDQQTVQVKKLVASAKQSKVITVSQPKLLTTVQELLA